MLSEYWDSDCYGSDALAFILVFDSTPTQRKHNCSIKYTEQWSIWNLCLKTCIPLTSVMQTRNISQESKVWKVTEGKISGALLNLKNGSLVLTFELLPYSYYSADSREFIQNLLSIGVEYPSVYLRNINGVAGSLQYQGARATNSI